MSADLRVQPRTLAETDVTMLIRASCCMDKTGSESMLMTDPIAG